MDLSAGAADLHMHTIASDGTSSVAERIDQASDENLDAIAITDHDCIADELSNRHRVESGLEIIAGVEVRANVKETKIEILGYYVDPTDETLRDLLKQAREYRHDRNRTLISNLRTETGVALDYENLSASTYGLLGRPHLARALVDAGVVGSVGEAFEGYLGADCDTYVPMQRVPAQAVIDAVQGAGGIASMAHPGRTRSDSVPSLVDALVTAGIDGIEVEYPYDDAANEGHADIGVTEAEALANKHGLLRTGGSDCHGPGSDNFRLGEVRVSESRLNTLRDRATERRPL